MAVYIGEVIDIKDPAAAGRIRVRLLPEDKWKDKEKITYAFPLLPKVIHVTPKVGEAVLVICAIDGVQMSQRYYIGPIIPQPQDLFKSDYGYLGASKLLKGGSKAALPSISDNSYTDGTFAEPDEVAVYSRQNSDVILSNDDVRIRCGARLLNPTRGDGDNIAFGQHPSFIKLKYHATPLENKTQPTQPNSNSTVTIVGDEINLLSHKSKDPLFGSNELLNKDGQISDKDMQKILDEAHVLPYGDVLVDFLMAFLQMFKAHTHKYPNDRPCPDDYSKAMDEKYGRCGRKVEKDDNLESISGGTPIEMVNSTFRGLYDKLLSKNVRIN